MAPLAQEQALASVSSGGGDKVGVELRFGGRWEPQADGVSWKYVGGQKFWEKVPASSDYAELMHRMSAKVNGAVTLQYAPPGEPLGEPENLVTCVDNDHVQEMFEEYWQAARAAARPGATFRLKIWLTPAAEEALTPEQLGRSHSRSSQHSASSAEMERGGPPARRPSPQQLRDVEMQEREAAETVAWIHDQEAAAMEAEADWQAAMAANLARARERTFDSGGWPRDRAPALRALQAADSLAGGSCLLASAGQRLPDTWEWGSGIGGGFAPPQPQLPAGFLTQDPSGCEPGSRSRAMDAAAGAAAWLLPSQLGSEVGDAPLGTADAAEKAHMECVLAGVVQHALGDGEQPSLGGLAPPPPPPAYPPHGGVPGAFSLPPPQLEQLGPAAARVARVARADVLVRRPIGEGTFGEVVLAHSEVFGTVAVKWLKAAKMDRHRDRFWEEACLLAALNHPNVLRFYGVVTASAADPAIVGIMTEFMHGASLSTYLRSGAPRIPLAQRAQLARGAVNGLQYLHALKVVHFDLKPDNLLLDCPLALGARETPGVKVADFGLSKQKDKQYVSGVRDLRGTLPYMAPELVSDPDHVTEAADVWSLGVVLWEMFTMETPYAQLNPQDIIARLAVAQRPELPADCEPEWGALMDGCMRHPPALRLTLREVAARLDAVIAAAPPAAPGTPAY